MMNRRYLAGIWWMMLIALTLSLLACGGGGGGGGGDEDSDGNVGAGWITIDYTTATDGSTERDTVYMEGGAFVSPTWYACCSGTAEEISGVTVTWDNATTGTSGKADQWVWVNYFFGTPFTIDHNWRATVPLVDGDNLLRVTATDPAGNIGRDSVMIRRIPAPPKVISTSPADGANGLPLDTPVTANFSEAMIAITLNESTFVLRDSDGIAVTGTVSYNDKIATFRPVSGRLVPSTQYSATVTSGAKDLEGNGLTADYQWSFTTGDNTWLPTTTNGAPLGRSEHSAVWAGSEMIVWGGTSSVLLNSGGRYDPSTDSWRLNPISLDGAPTPRSGHVAVWTGMEMIVWGGFDGTAWVNTGGLYNPVTNEWRSMSTSGAPDSAQGTTAVWTGDELIVWGGVGVGSGARYNPATNVWQSISLDNAPVGRYGHSAVWTGKEMIVWGGFDGTAWVNTGGLYDPVSNSWKPSAFTGAPAPRSGHAAVWTGSEMVVWGGRGAAVGNPVLNSGGRYDPITGIWRSTSTAGAPYLSSFTTVWSGQEMLVWGLQDGTFVNGGARYSPTANSWGEIPLLSAPSPRSGHAAVWTDTEMIIWGGSNYETGGRYIP